MTPTLDLRMGDAFDVLRTVRDSSVQLSVTSPPYFGLRSYLPEGHPLKNREIGRETTPELFIATMVSVFREVRRVLKDDGILFLNLGDSYVGSWAAQSRGSFTPGKLEGTSLLSARQIMAHPREDTHTGSLKNTPGLKPKDLMMLPQRVAIALQADGWYLRSQIPWIKRNVMPESVTDRPTTAVEYVFMLTKSGKYYYDKSAVLIPTSENSHAGGKTNGTMKAVTSEFPHDSIEARKARANPATKSFPADGRNGIRPAGKQAESGLRRYVGFNECWDAAEESAMVPQCRGGKTAFRGQGHFLTSANGPANRDGRDMKNVGASWARNRRNSDWFIQSWQGLLADDDGDTLAVVVNPKGYKEAHFATFPKKFVDPFVLAGSRPGDVVLDPFGGSGTVGQVALELGRSALLIELNPAYEPLIRQRCAITPGLALP